MKNKICGVSQLRQSEAEPSFWRPLDFDLTRFNIQDLLS